MKNILMKLIAIFALAAFLGSFPPIAAADTVGATAETTGISREEIELTEGIEPYSEMYLSRETKDLLAKIDGDIELLVVSSEHDFANGELFEHYYDLKAEDKSLFSDCVNTYKTIAEYNDCIKVKFLDPNSVYSNATLSKYSAFALQYGDLLISCYTNFDGNTKVRRKLVRANGLFNIETDKRSQKHITGIKVEEVITNAISALRSARDINVAVISDICNEADISQLRTYLWDSKYNFKMVSFFDEQFYGYDMILIVSPFRDITLEEANILETFLANGGKQGKSLAFFSPKEYVRLNNMYSLLAKWGIGLDENYRLSTGDEDGYLIDGTQIYAKSTGTAYSEISDSREGFYIMDKCTPMTVVSPDESIEVTTLLHSKVNEFEIQSVNAMEIGAVGEISIEEIAIGNASIKSEYPLLAVSKRTLEEGESYVIAGATSDILTSHFSRQNYKNSLKSGFVGKICTNLDIIGETFEAVNADRRNEDSGLKAYAVGLKEQGYETSSGLNSNFIMGVAFGGVAFVILLMIIIIYIADRRKKNGAREKAEQ